MTAATLSTPIQPFHARKIYAAMSSACTRMMSQFRRIFTVLNLYKPLDPFHFTLNTQCQSFVLQGTKRLGSESHLRVELRF